MKRFLKIAAVVLLLAVVGLFLAVRFLPPPKVDPALIARSVHQEPDLLAAAKALPVAGKYPETLHFQANPSLCGPASLVAVFGSLGTPFADEGALLDGTGKCGTGVCFGGLTLDELADVARAKGRKATVLRDLTLEQFRDELRHANDPDRRYVVNFTRKAIFDVGGGHHSPIGGYLAEKDLVYVLDVNERFRPWLVESAKLYSAIDTVDASSGRKRGLLRIE